MRAGEPPAVAPPAPAGAPQSGLSSSGIARLAAAYLARQPTTQTAAGSGDTGGGAAGLSLADLPGAGEPHTVVGPLAAGETLEDDILSVSQLDALHAEIAYGLSEVRLSATEGEHFTFVIGPPLARPPRPEAAGPVIPMAGGLVDLTPAAPAPELPQRVVHVTAPRESIVDAHLDPQARVPPLAVWTQIQSSPEEADPELLHTLDVIEHNEGGSTQLILDDTMVEIQAGDDDYSHVIAGGADRPRYAYSLAPEWTGPGTLEKEVIIVASPGIAVRRGSPQDLHSIDHHRRLVPHVVRVPHPGLVPPQGTALSLDQFIGIDTVGDGPRADTGQPDDTQHVNIATSLSGVMLEHPWSGARVGIRPTDTAVGGAYAYEVVPPGAEGDGEIRVIVGPGVTVDLAEPVPARFKDKYGGDVPTPPKKKSHYGEGIKESGFALQLIEVDNAARVPQQGTPINVDYFLGPGHRREPDHHAWLGTDDFPTAFAVGFFKTAISLIPIVGQLFMIGDAISAAVTGEDLFGIEVDDGGKVVLGIGAVLSLIPLAGGVSSIIKGSEAAAASIASAATRFGVDAIELENTMARVGVTVSGDDAAVVQRVEKAILSGEEVSDSDAAAIKEIVERTGAGELSAAQIAASETGQRLGLGMGAEMQQNVEFAEHFVEMMKSTGKVQKELAISFARRLGLTRTEDIAAAMTQTVIDTAKQEAIEVDQAAVQTAADEAAQATAEQEAADAAARVAHEARLQAAHPKLTADHLQFLREAEADLDAVERLLNRGFSPDTIVSRAIEGMPGPRYVVIMDALAAGKIQPNIIEQTLDLLNAIQKANPGEDVVEIVETLVTGDFTNPSSLRPLLAEVNASPGKLSELRLAGERADIGHRVQLGPVADVGGDVVDFTSEEVIQGKRVSSADRRTATQNLQEAGNQLGGKGKAGKLKAGDPGREVPPTRPDGRPFTRIARIEIANPNNELYTADHDALTAWVVEALEDERANDVDLVVVTNGVSGSPFTIDVPH